MGKVGHVSHPLHVESTAATLHLTESFTEELPLYIILVTSDSATTGT